MNAARITLTDRILEDLLAEPSSLIAALRNGRRFECAMKPVPLTEPEAPAVPEGGTVLIAGGFGGIGLTLAQDLFQGKV